MVVFTPLKRFNFFSCAKQYLIYTDVLAVDFFEHGESFKHLIFIIKRNFIDAFRLFFHINQTQEDKKQQTFYKFSKACADMRFLIILTSFYLWYSHKKFF